MSKTKAKTLLFIFLSVIGLVIGFFFSGYINILLSGGNIDDLSALRPAAILANLATDERYRLLMLCVEFVMVAGIAALMLMSRHETFESDTSAVAGSINTPVAIGQGQHGTARWLKRDERAKAFTLCRLEPSETIFATLLTAGEKDRKEIAAYETDPKNESAGLAPAVPPVQETAPTDRGPS